MSGDSNIAAIEQRTIGIINQLTNNINEITMDASLESLQINSIMFIKIIIALEEEFGIEFDDTKLNIAGFPLVRNFVEYLKGF